MIITVLIYSFECQIAVIVDAYAISTRERCLNQNWAKKQTAGVKRMSVCFCWPYIALSWRYFHSGATSSLEVNSFLKSFPDDKTLKQRL